MQFNSKKVLASGLIAILMTISACSSEGDGSGDNAPQRSNEELVSDTQNLNSEETSLSNVGLRIQTSYDFKNGLSTTSYRWDQAHLNKYSHVKAGQQIEALQRYVTTAEAYLAKYDRFQNDGGTYTLREKEEIQTKVKLAKGAIANLQPIVAREAEQAKIRTYTLSEFQAESADLANREISLQSKGIKFKTDEMGDQSTFTWDDVVLREYVKDQVETKDLESVKADIGGDIRTFQNKYESYLKKYGNLPFNLTSDGKTVTIDEATAVKLKLNKGIEDAKSIVKLLNEMLVYVGDLNI